MLTRMNCTGKIFFWNGDSHESDKFLNEYRHIRLGSI